MNILIIEDSKSEYVFLSGALERSLDEPPTIHHKENLKDALDFLQENKETVDLVFLDLGLPDTAGRSDAFAALKPYANRIPVIISTGDEDPELAAELLQEGAADYIVKGGARRRSDLLKETVYYALSRHHAFRKLNDELAAGKHSIHWLSGGYSV